MTSWILPSFPSDSLLAEIARREAQARADAGSSALGQLSRWIERVKTYDKIAARASAELRANASSPAHRRKAEKRLDAAEQAAADVRERITSEYPEDVLDAIFARRPDLRDAFFGD